MPMLQNEIKSFIEHFGERKAATLKGVGKTRASWMSVLEMGERREERMIAFVLRLITAGLRQKPLVLAPNHYRFVSRTGSDISLSIYCWF